ncbi:histone H1 [Pontibacter rugosus]|uniref:Histone H1 n=1 Tax=Pontibacter rugosus TaxID=1745966 RepID=A0ABW3SS76_9BACT
MNNNFSKLKDLVMSLEGDFEKFYDKGNAAAGTRVRKGMQDLKNMAQDIRKEVQDQKNANSESAK